MMFDEPVLLQLGWWYVSWARVSGPSSDCGSHGQATITTDDGYPQLKTYLQFSNLKCDCFLIILNSLLQCGLSV